MTDFDLPPEAVEAACRAVHPTRWEYPATAHPCDDCTTAVTAAGPIIAAEVGEHVAREIEARVKGEALLPDESTTGRTIRTLREDGLTEAARIAREEVADWLAEEAGRIARGEGS